MKTLHRTLILLSLTWAAGCKQQEKSEWPWLGQDLASTYNNAGETKLNTDNVGRLAPIWETKRYGNVNGAAAVVGDVVYVQSFDGTFAIRASNGEQIWANTNVTGTSSPTYDNGQLFVNDTAAVLHALNAKDGKEQWKAKIDPHPQASGFSSPAVFGSYVVVGSSSSDEVVNTTETSTFRGSLVAFDRVIGQELWRHYTAEPPYSGVGIWSSPSIDPETHIVYATTGNNYTGEASNRSDSIFAVRLETGGLIWSTQLSQGDVFTVAHANSPDSDFGTNPILYDAKVNGVTRKFVAAGQKSGTFWALDRLTGAVVWSREVSGGSSMIGGMLNNGAYDGSHILLSGNLGTSTGPGSEDSNGESIPVFTPLTSRLMALDAATGDIVWERQLPAWVWAPITVANGVGFVAYEKQLQAFDVRDGKKLFNYRTEGTITSAPVAVNGAVYFGSGLTYIVGYNDRTVHALAVDGVRVGGDDPDAGQDAGADAGNPPTFSAIFQQVILGGGCSSAFCHGAAAGNLLMSSQSQAYSNLVNVAANGAACGGSGIKRVDPGRPDSSLLLDKISHATPACGTVMPPGSDVTISQAAIDQVRAWIASGAPNN